MRNRQGDTVSAQISEMGAITFQDGQPFDLGRPFSIKNDGEAPCFLEVKLYGMPEGEFIKTRFETGWNPEIVKQVKPTSAPGLLWGN